LITIGNDPHVAESYPSIEAAEARRLLQIAPDASAGMLRRAFILAVKAAHPDRIGGDGERLRQVIEAYRRLAAQATPPQPGREARLEISPAQAMAGGWTGVRLDDGRALSVRLPAGLRAGDRVRVSRERLLVAIANTADAAVSGDDLLITMRVERGLMSHGGRLAIETAGGETVIWISKTDAARGFVRLAGLGLPARGQRPAGDLLLRLAVASEARFETPVRAKLRQFTAAWAA
jgi:curved DNA-binding protein